MKKGISFLISLVILVHTPMVAALSEAQKKLYDSNVLFADVIGGVGTEVCANGVFEGSENIEIAFNFFRSSGLTDEQAAGIVGNLYVESGVIPNRKQGAGIQTISSPDEITPNTGYGIAQWTSGGRQQNWINFANDRGQDALSLELELEFLLHELNTDPSFGYEELKQAQDVRQATWIFLSFFERPKTVVDARKTADPVQPTSGSAFEELNDRQEYSDGVLTDYGGTAVPTGGSCSLNFNTIEPDYAANDSIAIDNPPPGAHSDANCTGTFTVGAESLRQFVLDTWVPPVTSVGGYSCRAIVGGSQTSVHSVGRAIDIMVSALDPEGLQTGDEIRNVLINNAEVLGIQRVIWNRKTWAPNTDGWRDYTGENPHTDHLHVEINLEASENPNLAGGL